MDMRMDMDMEMGMESMGKSIIVDRRCRRTGCDGLMGEREMEMEMEEHTFIEKEGNEEKVMEEEEEGHAAVVFQGSTYLFFSCFFLGFLGGPVYYACMYVCMQATSVVLLYTCDWIWKEIGVELFVGVAFF